MTRKNPQKSDQLLIACQQGNLDLVRQLLDQGTDIEAANMHGQTCLILAAHHGHIQLVQLLLDRNADVNARDRGGNNNPPAKPGVFAFNNRKPHPRTRQK